MIAKITKDKKIKNKDTENLDVNNKIGKTIIYLFTQ